AADSGARQEEGFGRGHSLTCLAEASGEGGPSHATGRLKRFSRPVVLSRLWGRKLCREGHAAVGIARRAERTSMGIDDAAADPEAETDAVLLGRAKRLKERSQ